MASQEETPEVRLLLCLGCLRVYRLLGLMWHFRDCTVTERKPKQVLVWDFHGSAWLGGAERNPLTKSSSHDFEHPEHVPRSSADALTWSVVSRTPPAYPAAESARKDPQPTEKSVKMCKKKLFVHIRSTCKVPLLDVVDLESRRCREF